MPRVVISLSAGVGMGKSLITAKTRAEAVTSLASSAVAQNQEHYTCGTHGICITPAGIGDHSMGAVFRPVVNNEMNVPQDVPWAELIPPAQWAVYEKVLKLATERGIRFAVGGGFAF